MSDSFWLSDEQFGRLAPLLPSDTRGVPRVDDRRVISGIIHVLQSGCRNDRVHTTRVRIKRIKRNKYPAT